MTIFITTMNREGVLPSPHHETRTSGRRRVIAGNCSGPQRSRYSDSPRGWAMVRCAGGAGDRAAAMTCVADFCGGRPVRRIASTSCCPGERLDALLSRGRQMEPNTPVCVGGSTTHAEKGNRARSGTDSKGANGINPVREDCGPVVERRPGSSFILTSHCTSHPIPHIIGYRQAAACPRAAQKTQTYRSLRFIQWQLWCRRQAQ